MSVHAKRAEMYERQGRPEAAALEWDNAAVGARLPERVAYYRKRATECRAEVERQKRPGWRNSRWGRVFPLGPLGELSTSWSKGGYVIFVFRRGVPREPIHADPQTAQRRAVEVAREWLNEALRRIAEYEADLAGRDV